MGIIGWIRRNRGRSAAIAIAGLILAVAGFLWFRPDRLFVDTTVDESLPGVPAAEAMAEETATPEEEEQEEPAGPQTLVRGRFVSLEHETSGRARIVETEEGKLFLRFEDFETSNGPDLVVYLSSKPATPGDWYGYDQDFVDLGVLKGNIGDQNYRLPAKVDLDRYSTAVVWCRRFTVGFAAATLK
jgi:hypothetical protein